jgi:hypothetical protein
MLSRVSPAAAPSAPPSHLARVLVAVLLAAAFPAAPARAQDAATPALPQGAASPVLECSTPQPEDGTCVVVPETQGSLQRAHILLRLVPQQDSVRLRYRTSSGALAGDTITGDGGQARLVWYRPVQPDSVGAKARISVEALTRSGPVVQYIEVRPPTRELVTRVTQTFSPVASPGATLSRPMIVEIREVVDGDTLAITDPEICRRQRIAFRGQGAVGTFTPDTAVGVVYSAVPPGGRARDFEVGCFAAAGWKVGDGTGRQRVRPVLVPSAGYTAAPDPEAVRALQAQPLVRILPRFIVGPVLRHSGDFVGREAGDGRVIRVERHLETGEKIAYDSIPRPDAPQVVGGSSLRSMVGMSVPLTFRSPVPRDRGFFERLTLTVGVNPEDPRRDQYFGVSLFHLFNWVPETYPIELHFLGHAGSIDRLVDRPACRDQIGPNPCRTERKHLFRGIALSGSIDAGSVIADVVRKLAN